MKKENRLESHVVQLKQTNEILSSIKYTLHMRSVSSKLLITNGIIVCGDIGIGKTTVLHNIVNELNRLYPDSAVYVSWNDMSTLEWK